MKHLLLPTVLTLTLTWLIAPRPSLAQLAPCDNILLAAEHIPANSRSAGLANAGVAIPEGITGVLLNPSTLHTYNIANSTNLVGAFGYQTGEALFDRYNLTAGAGVCLTSALSCGVLYRNLKPETDNNADNQVTVNISGRLFETSLDKGMVNFGLNIRYEKLSWQTGPFDTLWSVHTYHSDADPTMTADSLSFDLALDGHIERRRLTLDLGFYQDNIGEGLDFGLTFHNLLGYVWSNETPTAHHTRWDSLVARIASPSDSDTVQSLDSNWYTKEESSIKTWIPGHSKRISVGLAFHKELLQDKARIYLPLDFEIFNLFDRETRTRLAFRTGLEAWVRKRYCLRFGYARAPEKFPVEPGDLSNTNIFSGGAGVRVSSFGADLYIRRSAWGLVGTVAF